mmetsp:Transcript_33161/g.82093  ORF Transcript_33161/g.82093 Transcript_33161/m.82093 type:complete len:87 (-) Transcript_33161:734-994(-)
MSDRPVGHLYGRDVYAFGDGGYAFEAKGDLRPLRKEDCKAVSLFANYSPTSKVRIPTASSSCHPVSATASFSAVMAKRLHSTRPSA